jgi:hypothetical protein
MSKSLSIALAVTMIGAASHAENPNLPDQDRYRLRLGSIETTPSAGTSSLEAAASDPFVLQLHELPSPTDRRRLESRGLRLIRYTGGTAYIARCPIGCDTSLADSARAALPLEPAMKRPAAFDTDPELLAWRRGGGPLPVHLRFFDWVPFERASRLLRHAGVAADVAGFEYGPSVTAAVTWDQLQALLLLPELERATPSLPHPGPASIDSGHRMRVDRVRGLESFAGADGTGQRVGVWDWFRAEPHIEYADRVILFEVVDGGWDHGLLVSGPIASAGMVEPRSIGMAPGAELIWHSWNSNDNWRDMATAQRDLGMSIVNNSWSIHPGWFFDRLDGHASWHSGLWAYGFYHDWTEDADQLVLDTDLAVVFAAGNEVEVDYLGPHTHGNIYGGDGNILVEDLHPPNPVYTSLAGPSVGKNLITVGGTTKDDELAWFSSRGPTLDGRVKPDVVAPAVDILSTGPGDEYWNTGGTSLSSPAVCGVAALLRDYYQRRHGGELGSATLKNLLIHSARDLGPHGPDFSFGHGLVDAELAARIVRDAVFDDDHLWAPRRLPRRVPLKDDGEPPSEHPVLALMIDDSADHGDLQDYRFPVGGAAELRATLVWHDPPAQILVNDLDVWLERPDGRVVLPWVPDPERPEQRAERLRNDRDNVEHIRVINPGSGWWTVVVEGYEVAMGPQPYSLIVSASDGNVAAERYDGGVPEVLSLFPTATPDDGSPPEITTVFFDGDPLNFAGELRLSDNAVYQNFFGSVLFSLTVRDALGEIVAKAATGSTLISDDEGLAVLETGWIIPEQLPRGDYTARFSFRLHNGSEATADTAFQVR